MKNKIKKHIVKIQVKNNNGITTGSGVILKSNTGKYYIFTAKHNFAYNDRDMQNVENIKLEYILHDIKNVSILHPYQNLEIIDAILLDNPNMDLIILVIKKHESLKNLDLKIFNDDFQKCIVAGYPEIRKDNSREYFDCIYETKVEDYEKRDDYKSTFEVYSTKPLYTSKKKEMKTIVGISGGGAFVEGSDGKIYLVGIEIEYKGISNLVCIDLRSIIGKINEELNDKIEVGGFSLYEKFGIDIEKLNLSDIKSEISRKNDYIIKDLQNNIKDIKEYKFLKDGATNYRKKIDKEYKKIGNLAKAFLYNGIVFHENGDYNRATGQFKKAVKLDSNLEVYFAQSKFQRKKGLSEKQKKEIEKNIANVSSTNEEQLIKNLRESIEKEEELESNILHLNHQLYKNISLLEYMADSVSIEYKGEKKFTNVEINIELKEEFNRIKDDIIKYTKKLSYFYSEKKDFQNAQRQLKGLQYTFRLFNDFEINKKLLDIYEKSQNDFFGNSCIDKKVMIEELVDFLNKFEPSSNEYKKVGDLITNYSVTDENYSKFVEKIKQFEQDYNNKIDSLYLDLTHVSNNIVDKDILMKIDFMLKNLTTSNNGLNLKINNMRLENQKFNQHILSTFKLIMQKGNRELEESIQNISNQNSIETRLMLNQLLRRFERGLGNLEVTKDEVDFSEFNKKLKEIVADEVYKFYTKINKSKDAIEEKDKIIRLIQKRYGEHVFSLKNSLNDKNKELGRLKNQLKELKQIIDEIKKQYDFKEIKSIEVKKELLNLKKEYENLEQNIEEDSKRKLTEKEKIVFQNKIDKLQSKIAELNTQLTLKEKDIELIKSQFREEIAMLNSWILGLESEYKESKQQSQKVSEKFSKLSDEKAKLEGELEKFSTFDETKKNDIKLLIDNHKREINELKNLIEQWKGKTEQLNNLKISIDLSSKTATTLVSLEKKYEEKIKIIEDRFKKIKHNPKNEKRLKKIFKEILIFENRLDNIKNRVNVYPIKNDSQITLHLLESDLEKIDDIIKKRYSIISSIYSKIRFFIISVIAFIFIVIIFGLGKGI